jgi:hypothetical protein
MRATPIPIASGAQRAAVKRGRMVALLRREEQQRGVPLQFSVKTTPRAACTRQRPLSRATTPAKLLRLSPGITLRFSKAKNSSSSES